MKPKYEVRKNWKKGNNVHNWKQGCAWCKESFADDESFVRVDVSYTEMRGDDDVYCFHAQDCWPKAKQNLDKGLYMF